VTLIDATRFPGPFGVSERTKRQLALADAVVLTKTDLVDVLQTGEALEAIRVENPSAPILHGTLSDDHLQSMLGLRADGSRGATELLAHGLLEHEHPHTLVTALPRPLNRERFEAFLRALPPEVLRAKGFITFDTEPTIHLFQYVVPGQVSVTPFETAARREPAGTIEDATGNRYGVFIGTAIDEEAILAGIDACLAEPIT
jgi:G3E family GTPase